VSRGAHTEAACIHGAGRAKSVASPRMRIHRLAVALALLARRGRAARHCEGPVEYDTLCYAYSMRRGRAAGCLWKLAHEGPSRAQVAAQPTVLVGLASLLGAGPARVMAMSALWGLTLDPAVAAAAAASPATLASLAAALAAALSADGDAEETADEEHAEHAHAPSSEAVGRRDDRGAFGRMGSSRGVRSSNTPQTPGCPFPRGGVCAGVSTRPGWESRPWDACHQLPERSSTYTRVHQAGVNGSSRAEAMTGLKGC
jgi:hypothetical protein